MFNPLELSTGAMGHLPGRAVPHVALPGTRGGVVDLAAVGCPRAILYLYPHMGREDADATPESCAFRDRHRELLDLGAEVYGISSQPTAHQAEAADRLHLPFPLLSDVDLRLKHLLDLPTFRAGGEELYRHVTLVVRERSVEHVFHPVAPSGGHADEVLAWLRDRQD